MSFYSSNLSLCHLGLTFSSYLCYYLGTYCTGYSRWKSILILDFAGFFFCFFYYNYFFIISSFNNFYYLSLYKISSFFSCLNLSSYYSYLNRPCTSSVTFGARSGCFSRKRSQMGSSGFCLIRGCSSKSLQLILFSVFTCKAR